jgi:hypothetical protein
MMMFRRLFAVCSLLALAACGGSGGSEGSPPFGSGGPPPVSVSDLVIVLGADTVANNSTTPVPVTVTALDSNRASIKGATISVAADADAVLTLTSGNTTNDSGQVVGTVSYGSNKNPRNITVTATSGSITKTARLVVVQGSGVPTAADLALVLSAPSIANSGTAVVTATATAVDVNRNAIAGIPITMQVDNGATILVSGAVTDATGRVTGQVGIGANPANRPIRVIATSGTLTREAVLQVTGMKVAATALPAVVAPGGAGRVQFKVTNTNNTPLSNFDISVSGVGGVTTTAKTDSNGSYEYVYTAPTAGGELLIRGASGGAEAGVTVIVQAGPGAIPNVPVGSVASASVTANPSVVTVNTVGSTENRAEIRALFVGANNAPIRNIRVRFDLNGDANSVGGTFTAGTNLVYSDVNGTALTSYIPGTRFSPTDGLTVRVCWDYQDFALGSCPNSALTTLTVISDALSVTIGTDNLVVVDDLVYTQRFVIQVNDSSGLAKSDVLVSPLLDLTSYLQGFWFRAGDIWQKTTTATGCENEDVNRNGVLETYANGLKEDANSNGQLDPRKADAVISFDGPNRTGATGQVKLKLTYPKNVGSWVRYKITVAATGVSGTEGRANFSGLLLVPITDVRAEATPAFVNSPYGSTDGNPRIVVGPNFPAGPVASLCSK